MTVKKKLYFVIDHYTKTGYHIFSSSVLAYDFCRKIVTKTFANSTDFSETLQELINSYCANREDFGVAGFCWVQVVKLDSEE